ncbi:hypothetical protein M407DRAFT_236652 [Tulasnella calospora MUT 4182]|uniref:Uncharacterized protein n=1 Tax=Tulasnella calospora MUT 4182 TaxID=1051891 RepID=A0A0C3L1Q5_9AGAM|nr:hypothetical protein M407DRAFT_236652 [Tulasnella calospora MUT 4182]
MYTSGVRNGPTILYYIYLWVASLDRGHLRTSLVQWTLQSQTVQSHGGINASPRLCFYDKAPRLNQADDTRPEVSITTSAAIPQVHPRHTVNWVPPGKLETTETAPSTPPLYLLRKVRDTTRHLNMPQKRLKEPRPTPYNPQSRLENVRPEALAALEQVPVASGVFGIAFELIRWINGMRCNKETCVALLQSIANHARRIDDFMRLMPVGFLDDPHDPGARVVRKGLDRFRM